jgi:MoxR-like ATPase
MITNDQLPEFAHVIEQYQCDEEVRTYTQHNHSYWRWIHGGLALTRKSPVNFDPRSEYWYCTERRLLAAFFATKFPESYVPVDAMRSLAFKTFRHFQIARADGRLGEPQFISIQAGLLPDFCDTAIRIATDLPQLDEYNSLRQIWGRRLLRNTLKDELVEFLNAARALPSLDSLERSFYVRLPWFPYMGLERLSELVDRQRFFYGYYQLLTSTNSYNRGGGLSFAPVIQNNPTQTILQYVEQWAGGQSPADTKFEVESIRERRDRSHHASVVELYGFLNLHRIPFNNSATEDTYRKLKDPSDKSIYDWLGRIGKKARDFVAERRHETAKLAGWFRELTDNPTQSPRLRVEGIRLDSIAKAHPRDAEGQVEQILIPEMNAAARARTDEMADLDAATAMLHLLLDASIYKRGTVAAPDVRPPVDVIVEEGQLRLPESLRGVADDALGYLHGGYHVLFAGPPGTGKTTLAQLVGHAWNHQQDRVADQLALSDAPMTTVGNSAWAPFHTIGGILPDAAGKFVTTRGIFVDPAHEKSGEWRLRGECVVLDEMNRADLDRCIGELYPLLSRSVERVHPAGIPGVSSIRNNHLFRVIATVNDATLDDIVFPISEGLARRFIRLELRGATEADLDSYLEPQETDQKERSNAARAALKTLYEVCDEKGRVTTTELGKHLPFGVGYFETLRAWVQGRLRLSKEFSERDLPDQAHLLLVTSLTGAARVRGLDSLLQQVAEVGGASDAG